MHIFLLFAMYVWYEAFKHRRTWKCVLVLALGAPAVPIIVRLYIFIFTGQFRPSDGAIMDIISLIYMGTLLFIGVFLAALPRVTPFFPCFKCKYDLRGNVTGQCPECGARIPKSAQIAIADDLTHLEQQIANDPERELLDPRAAQASA